MNACINSATTTTRRAVAMLLVCALAMRTDAQVGQGVSAATRRWGEALSGDLCAAGIGRLSFAKHGIAVECAFIEGVCRQAVYRAEAFDYSNVNSILGMNSSGQDWTARMPDKPTPGEAPRHWIRADETVHAELGVDALTVWDVRWRRRLDEVVAAHEAAVPAEAAADRERSLAVPGPVRSDIVGIWHFDTPEKPGVVLHVHENGDGTWIVLDDFKKQESRLKLNHEFNVGDGVYTVTAASSSPSRAPDTMGRLILEQPGMLRFHAAQPQHGNRRWNIEPEMEFKRVSRMPKWKPKPPKNRPARGDSKDKALHILGRPDGSMSLGDREALVYPWGNVWIVNGIVVAIE